MAHPRVFLSSTYYDLKNVRVALAAYIKELGYDVVLNETGSIAYGKSEPLDIYCYDEIRTSDILVALIGGRFGSSSSDGENSISQKELKTALDLGKQVYIFVDRNVLAEFSTYRRNRKAQVSWAHVDNVKIYEFLDQLFDLPINNAIFPFDDSFSVIDILREQWSGLFQRLLHERAVSSQITMAQELSQSLTTLKQIMKDGAWNDRPQGEGAISLTLVEHPAFSRLKLLLNVKYRVFFLSRDEMEDWLGSRSLFAVDELNWDNTDTQEWIDKKYRGSSTVHPLLKISNSIFDVDGKLKSADNIPWDDGLIRFENYDPSTDQTLS